MLARATCPYLSPSFDSTKHKTASFTPSTQVGTSEETLENLLARYSTYHPTYGPSETDVKNSQWTTFAEFNRDLLTRRSNWDDLWAENLNAVPATYRDYPGWSQDYLEHPDDPANKNTRRTPVAHAFAMWEGVGRVVQEGLLGAETDIGVLTPANGLTSGTP